MKWWLRNGDRWVGQAVVVWLLAGALCSAQQGPEAPAGELAPAAAEKAAAPALAAEPVALPQEGTVTAGTLVVRARPAAHYERIGQFTRGNKVVIVGGNADWYEVRVPADTRAWIAAQYVDSKGTVTADQVRLHSGPGLVFTTFCSARQGTQLELLGPPVDGWQQVRAPVDASAWISRAYVRTPDPEPPASAEVTAVPAPPAPPEAEAPAPTDTAAATPPVVEATPVPAALPPEPPDVTNPAPTTALPELAAPALTVTAIAPATEPAAVEVPAVEAPATEAAAEAPAVEAPATPPVAVEVPAVEAPATPPVAVEVPAVEAPATPPVAVAEPVAAVLPPEPPAAETVATPPEPRAEVPALPAPEAVAAPAMATTPPESPAEAPVATATAAVTPPTEGTALVSTVPPQDAPIMMKEGVLLSLKSQASELASHVLCMRVGTTAYPICYLKSARLDLTEWENREVRVYGREVRLPGWSLLVMHVHSIQVSLKP